MEMVIRQSDRIAGLPGHVGRGRSNDTKDRLFVSFDSLVIVLRSNLVLDFAWIWLGIRFCTPQNTPVVKRAGGKILTLVRNVREQIFKSPLMCPDSQTNHSPPLSPPPPC